MGSVPTGGMLACGHEGTLGAYPGEPCQCAGCNHDYGVCVDHESGSGCSACDGPVSGCDMSVDARREAEPHLYDSEGNYAVAGPGRQGAGPA